MRPNSEASFDVIVVKVSSCDARRRNDAEVVRKCVARCRSALLVCVDNCHAYFGLIS